MALDDLTDEQLAQLAGTLDIDTQPFMMAPPAGVLDFNQPVPAVSQALPSAYGGVLPNVSGINEPINPNFTISPEIRELVAREFNAQRDLGNQDIKRAALEAAGGRGMALSDTPIGDPYLRAVALLNSQLGGQEAQSVLGLGQNYNQFRENSLQGRQGILNQIINSSRSQNLAESQFAENAGENRFSLLDAAQKAARAQNFLESQSAKDFDLNVADFQNRLKQQAFNNRLQLSTTLSNLGLGLSGQRTGTPTGSVTTAPPDVMGGFGLIGRGLQAATMTPTSALTNSNLINFLLGNRGNSALGLWY